MPLLRYSKTIHRGQRPVNIPRTINAGDDQILKSIIVNRPTHISAPKAVCRNSPAEIGYKSCKYSACAIVKPAFPQLSVPFGAIRCAKIAGVGLPKTESHLV